MKGAIHIHSDYSYDGESSIKELKKHFTKYKYDFIILTEHDKNITENKLKSFIKDCKINSVDNFIIIPGVEKKFNNGLEIIVFPIQDLKIVFEDNIKLFFKRINKNKQIVMLPHPMKYSKETLDEIIESMKINIVEIWNIKHDGKVVPNLNAIDFFRKLKNKNKNILWTIGIDLHEKIELKDIPYIKLPNSVVDTKNILSSIREGKFVIKNNKDIYTPTKIDFDFYKVLQIWTLNKIYFIFKFSKKVFNKMNITPPNFLYKLKNKIF